MSTDEVVTPEKSPARELLALHGLKTGDVNLKNIAGSDGRSDRHDACGARDGLGHGAPC
jgi:hypothetical protein